MYLKGIISLFWIVMHEAYYKDSIFNPNVEVTFLLYVNTSHWFLIDK